MTLHHSATKTTKTHSHAAVTEAATSAAEAPTATTASEVAAPTPDPANITAAAKQASALLDQISAALPFDDPSAKEAKGAAVGNRVPAAALTIASSILGANPSRFPDLDPTTVKSAIDYDQALSPLLLSIEQLQKRTAKTLSNRRAQGATQTLALYQMLKGSARVSLNKATLVQQEQLEKLLKTTRKVRATSVTKKELQAAAAGMKVSKRAQAKAAKAAAANAEAQQAAALESAVLGTTDGATAPAATATQASTAPAATPAPSVTEAPSTVTGSH